MPRWDKQNRTNAPVTWVMFNQSQHRTKKIILMSSCCPPLCQGGSDLVINSAGPLSSKNQRERWLLFTRDIMNPAETDVSDQHYSGQPSFIPSLSYLNFPSVVSLGREESQLVWARQNCSEVRRAFGFSTTASFLQGDHLWTLSLGELSHQRRQPRDRWLWTLLQRREQRRDEQPFEQSKLQTGIFWAGRHERRRWAETVFPGGKWRSAEPSPPSPHFPCSPALLHHRGLSSSPADVPDSRLVTTPGLDLSPAAEAMPLLPRLFFAVQGIGKPDAAMMEMCFCFGSTSGHCMNVCDNILFPFFLKSFLPVCVWRCLSYTKAHPWWMLKRMSKSTMIHFLSI